MPLRKNAEGFPEYDVWAQQIFRSKTGGKDYIYALVRRKYGVKDVEAQGPGEYIGIKQEPIWEMQTDTDPDSPTYGKRVPRELEVFDGAGNAIKQRVQAGFDWQPIHECTKENLKKYRDMVANMPKPHGDTKFYWLLPEGKYVAPDIDEFFNTSMDKVAKALTKRKAILEKIEKKTKEAEDESEE